MPEAPPEAAFAAALLPVAPLVDEVRVAEPVADDEEDESSDELPDDPEEGGGGLGSVGSSGAL